MFRDYSNFEAEDFAFDESFQKWVLEPQSDQAEFWRRYMEEHPHQIDRMLAARNLVLELKKSEVPSEHDRVLAEEIWTRVDQHIHTSEARVKPLYWFKWLAASVIVLLGTGLVFWLNERSESETIASLEAQDEEEFIQTSHQGSIPLEINLPDGSVVALEKNSVLRYPKQFDARERVVYLEGEAFFNIAKDPKHPFLLFANKTVVKVLGTSFRVKAHENSDKVIVAVKSGKVSVFERKDYEKMKESSQMTGLVLMANQQAEFSNELEKFSKMIVPEPDLLDATDKKLFDFDRTPLPEVFEILQNAYGIEIIYDKDLVENRQLKVSLEDESLTEKLDIICQTMGLTYHIVDARIIIETQ